MEDKDYLIHYGVLGMKWGVRKDRRGGDGKKPLSKRKQAKSEKYRSSAIKAAKAGIKSEERYASNAQSKLNTLRKEGVKSKIVEEDYNSIDDLDFLEYLGGKEGILRENIAYLENDYEIAIARGKAFTEALMVLKKTDPSTQTVKEIKKIQAQAWIDSLNKSNNERNKK